MRPGHGVRIRSNGLPPLAKVAAHLLGARARAIPLQVTIRSPARRALVTGQEE